MAKFKLKKFIFVLFILCAISLFYLTHRVTPPESVQVKNILIWNSADRMESGSEFGKNGTLSFVENGCPVAQCRLVSNKSELPFEQYDAVLFNMLDIDDFQTPAQEGCNRSSHQRFVFLNQESPRTRFFDDVRYQNFFNWTMTYRRKADVLLIYGRVTPKDSAPKTRIQVERLIKETHKWNKTWPNKTKSVAWMVSHCKTDSRRETYVKELRKYIDVDVYGTCGDLSCPRNEDYWISDPQCYELLANNYKFYLSFENSICQEYATEKFFEILLRDLVPVVYGGANYSQLAPPHSFIDASQFTPRQLARYLRKVASNDTLYNEFFWWKRHYSVEAGLEQMVRHAYCDLCEKLHQDSTVKMYQSTESIWNDGQCTFVYSWDAQLNSGSNATHKTEIKKIRL